MALRTGLRGRFCPWRIMMSFTTPAAPARMSVWSLAALPATSRVQPHTGRFVQAWADDAAFMKRQPGFISTQLHQGTASSTTFVNVAVWESARALGQAFSSPEFQARAARYPDSTVAARTSSRRSPSNASARPDRRSAGRLPTLTVTGWYLSPAVPHAN
jgi:heme-degrading monooxygenase HmoA